MHTYAVENVTKYGFPHFLLFLNINTGVIHLFTSDQYLIT